MADSWPSDKASSLQALTGNGTRAGALCWTACYESACQQVAVCTDADPGRFAKGSGPARSTSSPAEDSRYLDYFRYVNPAGVTLVFLESKTKIYPRRNRLHFSGYVIFFTGEIKLEQLIPKVCYESVTSLHFLRPEPPPPSPQHNADSIVRWRKTQTSRETCWALFHPFFR